MKSEEDGGSAPIAAEIRRTVAQADPANALMFSDEHALSVRCYEYLIARRDQLQEKLRFGVLALNGASLVALISAVGGDGQAAKWLGFDAETAPISAVGFAIGAIFAGCALFREADRQPQEAADAYARQSSASILNAHYRAHLDADRLKLIDQAMARYHELPLVDLQFSRATIILQNIAEGAWLAGVVAPLGRAVGIY